MKHVKLNVLVIDVGGSHVKIKCTGKTDAVKFESGPTLTPQMMVDGVKKLTAGWKYDVVSIGCPTRIFKGAPTQEPVNLGIGWVAFDYEAAFERPVKIINDATMQALGDYEGGKMLFLGLGTGLGSTLIEEGILIPLEIAHLPYKKATFEKYVSNKARKENGKKKWRKEVNKVIEIFRAALEPEEIVIGGGNASSLKEIPSSCRIAENANAFIGGFRLWEHAPGKPTAAVKSNTPKKKSTLKAPIKIKRNHIISKKRK